MPTCLIEDAFGGDVVMLVQAVRRFGRRTTRISPGTACRSLRRYLRAHGYKWTCPGAARARCRSLVDERHGTSARAAVGADEHLILITYRCTCCRAAIDTDNPNFAALSGGRRTGRTGLTFLASRSAWSWRPRFPLFAGWTCGTRFSFWPFGALTAACQAKRDRNHESNAFRSYASSTSRLDRTFIYLSGKESYHCAASRSR
jgi:hypothetical protein